VERKDILVVTRGSGDEAYSEFAAVASAKLFTPLNACNSRAAERIFIKANIGKL
jgi:hypothetical protein